MLLVLLTMVMVVGCSSDESVSEGTIEGESESGSGEQEVLKLGHVWPSSEIHAQAMQKFKEEVEELTDGRS